MTEKTYTINLSGEDGASTSISLTSDVYEKLKTAFDELNDSCKYVSVTITEPIPTYRVYYIEVTRTCRPVKGSRTIIHGCDIPEGKNISDVIVMRNKIMTFESSEEARAYIESFKKK